VGDLLIRNLDPTVKEGLLESARKSGRSLSDEAALRLKHSLAETTSPKQPAGQRLRAIVDGFELSAEERSAIEASRRETDRAPPSLGSAQ